MAETVQDVFDDLLDSYKDFYKYDEFSYPGVADQEEAEYRERFADVLAAEKGPKSTPLTGEQKRCGHCHFLSLANTWEADTKWSYNRDQGTRTAEYCQWCGRKLGEPE